MTGVYRRRIYIYILLLALDTTLVADRNNKRDRLKALGVLNPHPTDVLSPEFESDTFFDPRDLVQVKYEMLRLARIEGASKSDAAARFGLSRPTYYQAERAYELDGLAGLLPRQRGPKGAHKLSDEVMRFIEERIDENEPIRARDLAQAVEARFALRVHPRSIERALARKKKRRS